MRVELVKTTDGRTFRREFAENEQERRMLARRAAERTAAGGAGMWEDRDAGDLSEDMVDDFSDE